ncbi:SpoIIE family protein phosphatase [Rubritalea spongiae]|uniref:SpoIIE family protein phosphatase n=1 Tax=Rubritalea spongiae TaxID=430797 RepID=A0ABW5E5L5_9BACT
MQLLTPAKNLRYISYIGLVFVVAFALFIIAHERHVQREAQLDTKHYSELLSPCLWNIDDKSAQEYVKFIAQENEFNSLKVTHANGDPFVSYTNSTTPGEIAQYLTDLGLIRTIHSEQPIYHQSEKIGSIYTEKSNRSIYTYFYLALLLLLTLILIALIKIAKINRAHQKRIEHDLCENRERLHSVVSASPLITFSLDRRGLFTVCEGMGMSKLHDSPPDIIGKSIEQVNHSLPATVDDFHQALRGESFSTIRESSGRTFETWYTPMREDDHITGVIGVATDVTAALQAVNSLQEDKHTRLNEHQLAQRTHQSLLPEKTPTLSGYEIGFLCKPSQHIGGDYLHFEESPHMLSFTFAEMSGHGVSSALLASIFHTQSEALLSDRALPLDKAFFEINCRLHDLFPEGRFAATFHAKLDSNLHTLEYIKASPEPAILFSKTGSAKIIDGGGPAIGLLPSELLSEKSFKLQSLALAQDDSVFVYSDGIVEVENHKGKVIERREIIKWVKAEIHKPPQQIVDSVYRKVLSHAGNKEILDDISMLILRRS